MMPALVREGRLTGFAMRYLGRLVAYLAVFFITFSLGYTLLLRWVPVTLTPLKAIRLAEHLPEEGLRVRSNWVPLRKVAMPMVRAVIATEDNHFLSHRGFDWDAIDRALDENREGKRLRGGSTISQQTAKNVFCLPARTWLRKGVEAWFTVLIETFWSKRRIMEVYLNVIETGRNMYGVEAPARDVYGKTAAELNAYGCLMENARRQLEQCRAALVQAEAEVERQRKIVLTATQELSGLDKLEEKQLEAYRLETARDTEQQISEQVSMRLVRKRSS